MNDKLEPRTITITLVERGLHTPARAVARDAEGREFAVESGVSTEQAVLDALALLRGSGRGAAALRDRHERAAVQMVADVEAGFKQVSPDTWTFFGGPCGRREYARWTLVNVACECINAERHFDLLVRVLAVADATGLGADVRANLDQKQRHRRPGMPL